MSTPEITPEIRQAVLEAECQRVGHSPTFRNALMSLPDVGGIEVIGPPDKVAHLFCQRCGKVWIVVEDPGTSYADAVSKLRSRMKDPDSVRPRPRPQIPEHDHE